MQKSSICNIEETLGIFNDYLLFPASLFRIVSHKSTIAPADSFDGIETLRIDSLRFVVALDARENGLQRAQFPRQNLVFFCKTTQGQKWASFVFLSELDFELCISE